MAAQQEEHQFTHEELLVISALKSLAKNERLTHHQLIAITGIEYRRLYMVLERLRSKGEQIISGKKRSNLGHRYAVSLSEFNEYLRRREKEAATNLRSVEKMRSAAEKQYKQNSKQEDISNG